MGEKLPGGTDKNALKDEGRTAKIAYLDRMPRTGLTLGPGARVGRYLLVQLLGEGGMGAVYEALDPELSRKVALKVLRPELADNDRDGEGRSRLLREAQAMARLNHTNVISVYDVGTVGLQVFIAMELVPGGTLRDWLAKHHDWRDVVNRFIEAGRGLSAAHQRGIVHRDFKAENILIGNDGRAIVTDFGLAREAGRSVTTPVNPTTPRLLAASVTHSGDLLGTPGYMAPEQYNAGQPDARSDQFSFCVSAYLALFHKHPFVEKTSDPLQATSNIVAGRPATIPPFATVPPVITQAILRGLSIKPEERYGSMAELLAVLESALQTPPASRPQRTGPGITIAVVGAVAALLGIIVALLLRSPNSEPAAPVQAVPQPVSVAPAPAPRPERINIALSSTPDGAWVVRLSDGKAIGKTPLLYEHEKGGPNLELELSLPGHAPARVSVPVQSNHVEHVTFRRKKGKTAEPKPANKPQPNIGNGTDNPFEGAQ